MALWRYVLGVATGAGGKDMTDKEIILRKIVAMFSQGGEAMTGAELNEIEARAKDLPPHASEDVDKLLAEVRRLQAIDCYVPTTNPP